MIFSYWWQWLGAILLLLIAWGILFEPIWLDFHRENITLDDIPPELDGLTIAFISDIHCGAWANHRFYDRAWKILANTNSDILLIGGDIVVSKAGKRWLNDIEGLRELKFPLGKFAVLGGHDRNFNAQKVTAGLRDLGIEVLHNRAIRFERQGCTWWLCGMADNTEIPHQCDVLKALSSVPTQDISVALVHSPDLVLHPESKRFSLILSGHTHAGQVRLPWWGSILRVTELSRNYDRGLSIYKGIPIFVSRGLGCTVRLRFWCRPEICLLTLHSRRAGDNKLS